MTGVAIVNALVEARERAQFRRPELAKKIGYDTKGLWGWEHHKASPSLNAAADWANGLGYDLVLVKHEVDG